MKTQDRIKHLKQIVRLLKGPKFSRRISNWMAVLAVVFAYLFSECVRKWGWGWSESSTLFGLGCIAISGGLAITCLIIAILPDARQINRHIEHLVADYEPVDQAGYANLCDHMRRYGSVDYNAVAKWVKCERECVERPFTRAS